MTGWWGGTGGSGASYLVGTPVNVRCELTFAAGTWAFSGRGAAAFLSTKMAMTVPTLRQQLNKWGSAHGASLKFGDDLPSRWLTPQAFSDADPARSASPASDGEPATGAGAGAGAGAGGGDDEFNDEWEDDDNEWDDEEEDEWGGDDEWGDDGAGDDDGGGEDGEDKVVGRGTEVVRGGISLETFAREVGVLYMKLGEITSQLYVETLVAHACAHHTEAQQHAMFTSRRSAVSYTDRHHAKQTKLFIDYAANMQMFKTERFDDLDTNHDAHLDRTELEDGIKGFGVEWLLPLPCVVCCPHAWCVAGATVSSILTAVCCRRHPHCRHFSDIDTDNDGRISFNEFQHWLKEAARRRSMQPQMARRTAALLRKRARRRYHVTKELASVPVGSDATHTHAQRVLAIIKAAAAMASDSAFMPAKEREKADRDMVRRVRWKSSTCFRVRSKAVGEQVAKRLMEKLAQFCADAGSGEADEVTGDGGFMFEDPDFGPKVAKAAKVVHRYVRVGCMGGLVLAWWGRACDTGWGVVGVVTEVQV